MEEGLFKYFPNLRDKVINIDYGSPLIIFYLGCMNGESYGIDMNSTDYWIWII